MTPSEQIPNQNPAELAQFIKVSEEVDVQAWEEIEAGRYMPRRIRGSFRGRALG